MSSKDWHKSHEFDYWDGAEPANCPTCGWYGALEAVVLAQADERGNIGYYCPKCNELLDMENNH